MNNTGLSTKFLFPVLFWLTGFSVLVVIAAEIDIVVDFGCRPLSRNPTNMVFSHVAAAFAGPILISTAISTSTSLARQQRFVLAIDPKSRLLQQPGTLKPEQPFLYNSGLSYSTVTLLARLRG